MTRKALPIGPAVRLTEGSVSSIQAAINVRQAPFMWADCGLASKRQLHRVFLLRHRVRWPQTFGRVRQRSAAVAR